MLLVLGLVVLLAHQTSRLSNANASIRWFFAATLFGAAGLELQSFREVWPPFLTIVCGNLFFLIMLALLNKALALYINYERPVVPYFVVLAFIVTGFLAFYTYVHPNLPIRILIASIGMPFFLVPAVILLLRTKIPEVRVPAYIMATIFAAHILNSTVFVVAMVRGAHLTGNIRWVGVVLIAGMCMCFLWMDMVRGHVELSDMAMRDPLTGLLNRRGLEELAPQIIASAARHQRPVSLLTVDINLFKQINDTHGHMIGDAGLLAVAEALEKSIRSRDLAVRVGGDEFMVLLLDCPMAAAEMICQRIHAELASKDLRTHDHKPYDLSVSIGSYTAVPRTESTYADFVHASDMDLYRQKQSRSRLS
ncbi:GGDEF domain-containing protein [Granulicella cerasi]|uniref:diguanylate cyclase n=2 Tax=Granulicella cerasi TaxID=741063 RepID=A0ABW1Z5L9_9BACT